MNRLLAFTLCVLGIFMSNAIAQTTDDDARIDSVATADADTTGMNRDGIIPSNPDPDDPDPLDPLDPLFPRKGDTFSDPIVTDTFSTGFSYSNTRHTMSFTDNYRGRYTRDIFYRFTITAPMNVTITHDGSELSDTYMTLLRSDSTVITANNDYSGDGHCSNTHQAFIRRQLSAGTYYVVSEGFSLEGSITTNITGNTESGFNYPTIPSTYSTNPGKSVGGMGGQFAVSPMGGATYSIPIEVPQGVDGLQPQLSIVYNSQSGNGLCGYGASLAGLSSITRGPKDIYHDGAAQGMKYLSDDALYLDGVRLILSDGTAGQNGAVYHPESDPFTTVTVHNNYNVSNNTMYFEVKKSDGLTYYYGDEDSGPSNSKVLFSEHGAPFNVRILSWHLKQVIDVCGNYIDYTYIQSGFLKYISEIQYGGNINDSSGHINKIRFEYSTRQDSSLFVFYGYHGFMARRLISVTSTTNDEIYRSYTLNYNTTGDGIAQKYSRLVSVTEENGQEETLPSTLLNWSYLPSPSYAAVNTTVQSPNVNPQITSFSMPDQTFISGDLNDDGISDIIGMQQVNVINGGVSNARTFIYVYESSRSSSGIVSFPGGTLYNLEPTVVIDKNNYSGWGNISTIDFDGDGIKEILIPCFQKIQNQNEAAFILLMRNGQEWYLTINLTSSQDEMPRFTAGDLDNDGKDEIIYAEHVNASSGYLRYHILKHDPASSGGYGHTNYYFESPNNTYPERLYVADMDGDGMNDIVSSSLNSYTIYWNQGDQDLSNSFSEQYSSSAVDSYQELFYTGDFNGDGLMDFLSNSSENWFFHLNNGDGSFNKCYAGCINGILYEWFTSRDDDKFHCDVLDFDGDGRSDVVVTKAKYDKHTDITGSWGTFNKTHTYWMRSTGTTLVQVHHATSNRAEDAYPRRFITGDFNGDGRMELANYGYDCVSGNNANSDPVWYIYCNNSLTTQSGKVTSVTGDFGTTTSITYSTLADNSVYTRGTTESYPAPRYTIPLNVVKQTVQDNGASGNLTTKYTYEGLKAHLRGRGLLGFSKTTANCTSTGVRTENGILQWDTIHYIPKVTYSLNTIGGDTSCTTINLTIEDKGQRKYFAYPSQTITTDIDGFITTTYRSYNTEKGYITSDSTVYASNMYRAVSYKDYTPNKVGGTYRPQTVVQSQRHPDDTAPFSTTTTYTYNSNTGTVATKVENYGSTKPLTISYDYDQYGNITSQAVTGSDITACATHYQYDATKRFPVRIYTTPSSSVKKYTYDQWGHVLTIQDSINSSIDNKVTHTYDGWGVLAETVYADSSKVTYTRGWSGDAALCWFVLEQGTACPWVKTWYDSRGREVKTESVGAGNVSVVESVTYNSKGLLTLRITTTGDLTQGRNYEYDYRGRLQREQGTNNIDITHSYGIQSGGIRTEIVTEAVNDGELTTTYVYDAWGNLKSVTDPVSSVSNSYSSNGGVKQTSSRGVTWTFGYDDRGNRTSLNDPDAGITKYVYDALGRETSRTDSLGIVFVTNYDYLGRVTQRSAGSSTVSYTYGTSGNGQMSLISESNGTWTKNYTYDNLGRVTGETMSKGNTFSMNRGYNYGSNGLLSTAYMPGNKAVHYAYDSYGNITGLDFNSGTIAWSLTGYTGRRTTSQTVLNGGTSYPFVKTVLLDQYGYLDSLVTIQSGCPYQEEKYIFDPIRGNLTQKDGYFDYSPYTYTYDIADRLLTVSDTENTLMTVTYSPSGNINSKTGIGNYTYGNQSKPHAVTEVENIGGLIDMNTQELSFNNWNRLAGVWQTDDHNFYSYSIDYGPDLKRVTSEMHKTYQKQYEKFYWDDYEEKYVGSDTLRYWYIYTPGGLEGLYIEKSTPNGMTSHTTKVITDHLGSIESLIDNGDWVYDVDYDAWGKREVLLPYWFDPTFDRGYCGHEHIDELELINMNGRMYDPLLGRFLSPDNYIQSTTNPQNYNRYSYCLNNPLKYSDPSGDIVWLPVIIGAAMGGYSGYRIGSAKNATGWEMFGYIAGGVLIGGFSGYGSTVLSAAGVGAGGVGAITGSFSGSMFNMMAKGASLNNYFGGAFIGGTSVWAGGYLASAIGGGWGALIGGSVSNLTSQIATNKIYKNPDFSVNWKSVLLGGLVSLGTYHTMSLYNWKYQGGNNLNGHYISYRQYCTMNADFQRSRVWRQEYGGWLLKNGKVARWPIENRYGLSVSPTKEIPEDAFASYHTHWAKPGAKYFEHNNGRVERLFSGDELYDKLFPFERYHSTDDLTHHFSIGMDSYVINRYDYSFSPAGNGFVAGNDVFLRYFLFMFNY